MHARGRACPRRTDAEEEHHRLRQGGWCALKVPADVPPAVRFAAQKSPRFVAMLGETSSSPERLELGRKLRAK
jgi:hypothetical protein